MMTRPVPEILSRFDDEVPQYEPYDPHTPDGPLEDSEIDFDDDWGDDQLPLDQVEAAELGVNLDDPESLEP